MRKWGIVKKMLNYVYHQ